MSGIKAIPPTDPGVDIRKEIIVEKHYCDICRGEAPADYVKAASETAQTFSGTGFQDVCCHCFGKAKSISWREAVQSAVGEGDFFSGMQYSEREN